MNKASANFPFLIKHLDPSST